VLPSPIMEEWSEGLYKPEDQKGIRLTLEEWLDLPEDESGEFVDGVLREEEAPDSIHELAVSWLIALFRQWLGPGNGFVWAELSRLDGE
jgi:Uma2 family endonuclease